MGKKTLLLYETVLVLVIFNHNQIQICYTRLNLIASDLVKKYFKIYKNLDLFKIITLNNHNSKTTAPI